MKQIFRTRCFGRRLLAGLRGLIATAGWLFAAEAAAHGAFHERMAELANELEHSPADARVHFELATLFCAHGDWAFAIAYADGADELQPGAFATDLVRGEAWLGAGQPAKARQALDRHVSLRPSDGRGWILRARVIAATDGLDAALGDFRAAATAAEQRNPDHAREAAAAFVTAGRPRDAIELLARALDEFGADPALLLAVLPLETEAGRWSAALERIDALEQTAPRPEPWMARRAEILEQAGRMAEARAAWQELGARLEALPNLERGLPLLRELAARVAEKTGRAAAQPLSETAPAATSATALPLSSPEPGATAIGSATTLTVDLPDSDTPIEVTFYGRKLAPPTPGPDFAIGTLPDTQYYSENLNGRSAAFYAQTRWYADNRDRLNFAFVSHMGDIVNSGDLKGGASNESEWIVADTALRTIENPVLTLRAHGIPWGAAPGNHDETPNGNAAGTTTYFNQYFGLERFAGRRYCGGHYGANNNNNYELFSASGLDFIILHLQYDARGASLYQPVLDWADAVLKAHPHRRAIVTSHWIVNTGNPASFSAQGRLVYDRLKNNPNFFLMLCGHVAGEGRRTDVFNGHTVYSILQDYQSRANGGDGWLRYYVFAPSRNVITAKTYSPVLNRSEVDADSEFTLPYDMQNPVSDWLPLGTVTASPGAAHATVNWTGLEPSGQYEWYATVRTATGTTASAPQRFATAEAASPTIELTAPTAAQFDHPVVIRLAATASSPNGAIARVEFYQAETNLGAVTTPPYELTWSAPRTGRYWFSAVAVDATGATALSQIVPVTVINPNNQLPTIAWTSPTAETRTFAPASLTLAANAADADGTIAKVEFFVGPVSLGERTAPPYSLSWPNIASGTYALTVRATDNDGGVTTSPVLTVTVIEPVVTTLVPRNAVWKYLDNGSDQGTAWRAPGFDDSAWRSGPAELGYGDGDEATIIGFGPNPASRAITTYFRHTFTVATPAQLGQLVLNLQRDDGAIVYLNGVEIGRSGLTPGVNYLSNTPAPVAIDGADERTFFPLGFTTDPTRLLVRGDNVLAVEVHQQSGTSSDVSFALELFDWRFPVGAPPSVALTSPAAGAVFVAPAVIPLAATASDADGKIARVEFIADGISVGVTTRAPYVSGLDGARPGPHTLVAVATDNEGNFIATPPTTIFVREPDPGRFINFSVRSNVGSGMGTLIVGFVTGGEGTSGSKPLLLRAIGPGLAGFRVAGFVADPAASLYAGSTMVATNDNWGGNQQVRTVAAQVGAFPLTDIASTDAALMSTRASGGYSLQVTGASGTALAEIYDATPATGYTPATPRLINASVRTLLGADNDVLIAGFVLGGTTERNVLVRCIGPGLAGFGVTNPLAEPNLRLFRGDTAIASNEDWGGTSVLLSAFARAGAFALAPTSRDAALIARLAPGAYTAQVTAPAGTSGVVLLDIYELP